MNKIPALVLGISIMFCHFPGVAAVPTPTITLTALPPVETATFIPTFTPAPLATATWVHQGPYRVTVPIILYHRIDVSPINSRYYVPPEEFEKEIKLLHDWEYTTITTGMLFKAITEGADLPPRPIIITFDDGNLDNYTTAFPIMQKYGFTGVLYIVGKYMGAEQYMSADQIKEMAAAGWEVGSHSMTHSDLTLLEPQEQRREIVESKEFLERQLGIPIQTFAYPFGTTSPAVLDYAYFAGYMAGMSLGSTHNQGTYNLFNLQRRDIKGTYDLIQFAQFLPWHGDPLLLQIDTPIPEATSTPE
jgi:peptidoglycan/xylan/chitin deacetylase (PgdA/CDA1 family)